MDEEIIRSEVRGFITRAIKNLRELRAEALIEQGAINPFLMTALGFNDVDALARFYVYQRVGRSVMTGFGTTLERIVRAISEGHEGDWWDIVANMHGNEYFMSVKSGTRDMNRDQVSYFSGRARELLLENPDAIPIIALCYGREPWQIIPSTLQDEGFDPNEHLFVGKRLYEMISGQQDFQLRLLEIIHEEATNELRGRVVIDLIEEKVEEISEYFKTHYRTVEELLNNTF